jgi:hypothetical protein
MRSMHPAIPVQPTASMEDHMSAAAAWDPAPLPSGLPTGRPGGRPGGRPEGRPHLVLVPTGPEVVAAPRLRLTRAGRLALTVTALVATLALAVLLLAGGAPAAPVVDHATTVRQGQTLSEVAAEQLPQLPVAEAVARIQVANSLSSTQVHAGQSLLIPAVG